MIVELIGPPGSGKSTLSKYLYKEGDIIQTFNQELLRQSFHGALRSRVIKTKIGLFLYNILPIFILNKLFVFNYRINSKDITFKALSKYGRYFGYMLANLNESGKDKGQYIDVLILFLYELFFINKKQTKNNRVIFDGGFIFRLSYLSESLIHDGKLDKKALKNILDIIPFLPDVIVYINSDTNECMKRIKGRLGPGAIPLFCQGSENNCKAEINKIKLLFEASIDILQNKGVKIIFLDSQANINDSISFINKELL